MKNYKRFILIMLFCAVAFVISFSFFMDFSPISGKSDQFVQDKQALKRLLHNSSEIHRIWKAGEESREWSLISEECKKELRITKNFDESLLRCSPLLLQCHSLFSKNLDYSLVTFEESGNLPFRYLTKSNSSYQGLREVGIAVTLVDKKSLKKLDIFLEDNCHEVYLEQRAYAYGEQIEIKDGEDYRFDNFDRHIYLDTHLVTNFDINMWLKFGNPDFTKGISEKKEDELFLPAVFLTYTQMESYCSYKGRQVLQAHFLDAASFLPMDLNEKIPKRNLRSPYYWTKKASEYKSDCKLLYSKDCLGKREYQTNSSQPSWAGLFDTMGGVFEAVRNPIDGESNLKASSYYFDSKSSWHKIGFRAGWNGEGFGLRDFDFRGLNPYVNIDKFKVGFRCMREILQ
ncbi:MAG: hypothetical protein HOP07_03960 [Bacteriovoracaceae bacterium]|nr:hypothetical protein [Bacteriovoracaceae bacterium]